MFYLPSNEQALFPPVLLTLINHEAWRPNMNYHRTDSIQNMSSSTMNSTQVKEYGGLSGRSFTDHKRA